MNQLIQTIKVLSSSEVAEVNDYIDTHPEMFFPSGVFKDDGSKLTKMEESVRSSWGCTVPQGTPIEKLIHSGINRGLQTYRDRVKKLNFMFQFWPIPGTVETFTGREDIQLLTYTEGQIYKFHHDQADFPEHPQYHRTLSTVLYLNDGFEGGGTEFPHKTFKPKPGYALYFPSNWCYPHSGQEVTSGQKKVAVTWWYTIREPRGKTLKS
jgi:hypothetical protein